MISVTPCSKFRLYFVPLQASGPRAAATRPLLLHRHKTSRSSAHSYQVCPTWQPRPNGNIAHFVSRRSLLTNHHHLRNRGYPFRGIFPLFSSTSHPVCRSKISDLLYVACFFPARYILPPPLLFRYPSPTATPQVQFKAPSSTSVLLQCLHPNLTLTNLHLRNPPQPITLPATLTPIRDLPVPCQNLPYQPPPNLSSTDPTCHVSQLMADQRLKTLRLPPCLLLSVQSWSRRLAKSHSCLVKHLARTSPR